MENPNFQRLPENKNCHDFSRNFYSPPDLPPTVFEFTDLCALFAPDFPEKGATRY